MDKTRIQPTNEIAAQTDLEQATDVRTLKDLELVLVGGGGEDVVTW